MTLSLRSNTEEKFRWSLNGRVGGHGIERKRDNGAGVNRRGGFVVVRPYHSYQE
jgi:hypothetical protein